MSKVPSVAIRRQIIALIPVYMNVFMMGCCNGWIPNAIYFLLEGHEISASITQCSVIASCSELGRLIFAIPGGILADKYGRKKIVMVTGFLHFFSWCLISAHTSLIIIYIGRFALGIATALVNATALISIGEIASPEMRGKLTSIYLIFLNGGILVPCIISAVFSSYNILSYGIAFLSSFSLISIFWMMETPNHLISISKHDQAKNHLKRIRLGYPEIDIDNEFEKLRKYIEDEKARKNAVNWLIFIKSSAIRKPLIIAILLNYFTMGTGGSVIVAYVTAILPRSEFLDKRYYPLIMNIILLLIAISTTFYIEKFPRRVIFITGAGLMVISTAMCALMQFCFVEYQDDIFKWIFLLSNILTCMFMSGLVIPINSAIKSELFPQAVKGFGGSLGVIAQSTATIVLYQIYERVSVNFGLHYVYVIFSVNALVLCLLVHYLLPEGRGKFLADVQTEFKSPSIKVDNEGK